MKLYCLLLLGTALLSAINSPAQTSTLDVDTPPSSNFATASFRFWWPVEAQSIRGIAVLVPGSNADGRPWAQDAFWQDFARRHQFALVGCCFKDKTHPNMNIEEYALASAGSGQALLDAIAKFAANSHHLDAARAPLALWGHSAGGEFNYEFACWKPDRVAAFVVNKGGYYYTHLAPAPTRRVPRIFFIGEKDEEFRVQSVRGIFAVNRRAGAVWTFAAEPNAGHEPGKTRELAAAFFDAIVDHLPAVDNKQDLQIAMPSPVKDAWLGDLKTFETRLADPARPPAALTAWLPNQTFAGL